MPSKMKKKGRKAIEVEKREKQEVQVKGAVSLLNPNSISSSK